MVPSRLRYLHYSEFFHKCLCFLRTQRKLIFYIYWFVPANYIDCISLFYGNIMHCVTHFVEQTCSTDYHTVFRCAEEDQISSFDPLQHKIRCRSARKKAQILKMLTSRRRYVQIPGNSVLVSLRYAGRRTKFAPVKSLDSSDSDSKLSDLKVLASNVKVNPVIS